MPCKLHFQNDQEELEEEKEQKQDETNQVTRIDLYTKESLIIPLEMRIKSPEKEFLSC